jgi:hypothetical protein
MSAEMPFTREAYPLGEKERSRLNELLRAGNLNGVRTLVETLYNDVFSLLERAATFREYTAMSILQTGKVNITSTHDANVQTYTVDYDPDNAWAASNIIDITTPWENAAAKPLVDIINAVRYARKTNGTIINRILLSTRLYNAILANATVTATIFPNYSDAIVGPEDINRYLATKLGTGVQLIDFGMNYRNDYIANEKAGTPGEFIQADRAILLPAGNIGRTLMGVTPEEDALAYDPSLNISVVDGGVALNQTIEKKTAPWRYEIVASQVALQSAENLDSVYGLNVSPAP